MSFQLLLRVARLAVLCTIAVLIAAFPARADAPPAAPEAPANSFAGQILSNAKTGRVGIGTTLTANARRERRRASPRQRQCGLHQRSARLDALQRSRRVFRDVHPVAFMTNRTTTTICSPSCATRHRLNARGLCSRSSTPRSAASLLSPPTSARPSKLSSLPSASAAPFPRRSCAAWTKSRVIFCNARSRGDEAA